MQLTEQNQYEQGIYAIFNSATSDFYVGQTNCFGRRKQEHWNDLRNGTHVNEALQTAWNKYGEERFVFTILEIVKYDSQLPLKEHYWIDRLGSYNS